VDSIGGDGSLEEEELVNFMFPGIGSQLGDDDDTPAEGDRDAEAPASRGKLSSPKNRAKRRSSDSKQNDAMINPML
jgi:hypothetical protein